MSTLSVVHKSSANRPSGVFYGSIFCTAGKAQTTGLHGSGDFSAVALALFNTALAFLAKCADTEVDLAVLGSPQSLPVGTDDGGISAYAVISHPSWDSEYSLLGNISGADTNRGSIDHFDRLLELVLDVRGQPLMAAVRKRSDFHIGLALGFQPVQG